MICGHDLSKTYNKGVVFICKSNFRPIFLSNMDIKFPNLGYHLKIQIFIFMSKKRKANIKKLVASSNFTEYTERHVELIYFVNTINEQNI